jgi:hypothetical protein
VQMPEPPVLLDRLLAVAAQAALPVAEMAGLLPLELPLLFLLLLP